MDATALFKMSYGLYVISTSWQGKDSACVVNTLQQVTNMPNQLSVAVHKENFTCGLIEQSGMYAATVLTNETEMNLLRYFGFRSSKDVDKFEGRAFDRDQAGLPYLTEHMAARYSMKVTAKLDVGTHMLFVGEVLESEILSDEPVMTYEYYHKTKNGITPPKASGYQAKPRS